MEEILFDPQTSGGLLVSLKQEDAEEALKKLNKLGLPAALKVKMLKIEKRTL